MNKKISFRSHKYYRGRKTAGHMVVLAVVLGLCIWLGSAIGDFFGMCVGSGEEKMVNIPKNSTVRDIADILDDSGIIRHKFLFRVFERISGDNVFQQGSHKVGKGQSYSNIIKKLTSSPEVGVDETVTVLIPEGFEAWQIAEKLEEMGIADKEEFLYLLDNGEFDFDFIKEIDRKENRLEGYLFPATYELFVGESEHSIIVRMLQAFEDNILPLYEASDKSRSLDEIVTMASLVEREAANDSERGRVASVFYNRIQRGMALGSCATVQYIIKERKDILSNSDTKIKSPYNTYINPGLPVGPIASPGVKSVMAALHPEKTDYLYFAARPDGSENVFSRTNEEHIRIVNMLQGRN